MADALRDFVLKAEEEKRPLCDQVRAGLLEAIGLLAGAANHPLTARRSIQDAHEHIKKAFEAALELDPIEEPYQDDEQFPKTGRDWRAEDERLDDPRHGQAESLNAGRY